MKSVRRRSLRREEGGQALVELALTIPLLLFVLFAIIDFGLAINQANSTTNLANIAVREAAVIGTTTSATCNGTTYTSLQGYVACEATAAAPSAGTPTVYVCDTAGSSPTQTYNLYDPIKVVISTPFSWLRIVTNGDGRVAGVGGLSSTITASATMRLESAPGSNPFLTAAGGTPQCLS